MFTTPFAFMAAPAGGASLPAGYTFYVDASDPTSYPGTGTTWYDLSGNGYNMTLSSAGVFVNNGGNDKYMDFGNGIAKYLPGGTLTNIPTTDGEEGTWVFYTSPKSITAGDYKTLLRGKNGNHPVIVNTNGYSLGLYVAGPYFAFDLSTITNVVTEPHMMAWQLKISTTPNWSFFYDSFTSSAQATINANVTVQEPSWASASLGAWHENSSSPTSFAQTWGKIWFAAYYPFLLSTAELDQVNDYIAATY
jgi:hypothetical protein